MAQPLERPLADDPASPEQPRGALAARVLAMPPHANPMGTIFGGWLLSFMDSAGGMTATKLARGPVVTAAVSNIDFLRPVRVGDVICCYTDVVRIGTSSITLSIEVWVLRQGQGPRGKVTDAEFTFVAIDEAGKPRPVGVEREEISAERHPYPRLRA
jgi:acyl-CoA thioesterase YciA